MVAANKLLHLLEAFSTTWFLFSAAQNHHLVFFLLEAFNNIIQYQFDGKLHPVQCDVQSPALKLCIHVLPVTRKLQPGLRNHP